VIREALDKNPEIRAAERLMESAQARVSRAGALDDPELTYMREKMPGFRFNQAMDSRLELSQMLRFPTKLMKEGEIGEIQAEHAHHDHLEKINDVVAMVREAYLELWFIQNAMDLNEEHARLLREFATSARTRYSVGTSEQQDVLKAHVELAKLENQQTDLRARELGAKAALMALLNRASGDTLGTAVLPAEVLFTPSLEKLQSLALQFRPMLLHDSLVVDENRTMLSLSKLEYIPDIRLALQYVTGPVDGFRGWSVSAGITIPFAPWTLGKAGSRVQEATAAVKRQTELYTASKNSVIASVRESYFRARSAKQQLDSYQATIIPQARQSLQASITAYQTGKTDFLMLIDAYRTLVELRMDQLTIRMKFELAVAQLDRSVGFEGAVTSGNERN
jgi:outer membrane protein TolC